ncbi:MULTISPECIES: urate hydroxylase PuuD [unclassified Simplicispira]|uniref:urate hydroxylase PuuD n=1 Tax=unclassified Simplicispira TaxID=2630407 RepID=UPI000D5F55BA|nr:MULTISPECIES: urate hydroxylase PuuD [unclassified Simplicispira]PVY54930.1 putative membrane protein [Simplicispira sp. 125]REG15872.1 putative membrane protein [Simplicispira sp. 110]
MESYLLDWANLLLRWVHVITAIAWIGSSFYFVFLDSSLTPPEDDDLKKQGVSGELWAVHGGGFYHPVKFNVSPPKLPGHLHWFYWESYSTWLSGFSLFTVSYLWSAGTYLVDKSRMDWAPATAVVAALAFLVVFWLLYDAICRVFGQRKKGDAIVGALVLVLVCIASWLACHWFAGRAAFLLVGAMMATAMSANVFFWIIPGQRTVVADLKAGRPVDPIHGKRGKQRSVHNTYFTLPVLFAMLSGHYSFTWSHPQNWLVLILMMFAGAAIRQFFVLRHGFKLGRNAHPWPYALVGVAVIVGAVVWLRPAPVVAITSEAGSAAFTSAAGHFDYAKVQAVLQERCVQCHGPDVQMKGVRLDSAQQVAPRALLIYQQVVLQKLMPMNNATQMTDAERDLIARWHDAGAPVQ